MEKNNIEITTMTEDNLHSIKDNLVIDFDDFWTYNILKQELDNANSTYIVAKDNGQIIGFAGMLTIIDEANIMNIVIKKDKRRFGIGTLLLTELISISKKNKLKSITLEVNEHNIPAINLYKKFKFEQVGIRKKYYNNMDSAILMTLYF